MLNSVFTTLIQFFADLFSGNYGLAIIALTLAIRFLLLPLIIPSLKSQQKIREHQKDIVELKKKYGHDKQLFAQKQMEFYQQKGINPMAGCLPQLVQLGLFIAFYQFLISTLSSGQVDGSLKFLWLSLDKPDSSYLLPVVTALTQFILGLMLVPATDTTAEKKLAAQTPTSKDDSQAMDMDNMAKVMQTQMVFIFPLMTGFLALRFPSGLALYWVTTTVFSIIQQYYVSGLGGLIPYLNKLGIKNLK